MVFAQHKTIERMRTLHEYIAEQSLDNGRAGIIGLPHPSFVQMDGQRWGVGGILILPPMF